VITCVAHLYDGHAEHIGGLHVDHQLEFGRLIDGQLAGSCALQLVEVLRPVTPVRGNDYDRFDDSRLDAAVQVAPD